MAKILLVEDEEFLRDIYLEVLTAAGHDVDLAEDGLEGYTKVKKGGYDLVLLDVMLPEMDARQILIEINKKHPETPNKGYAYMTNLTHDTLFEEGKKIGVKGVIIKSELTPDQFVAQVETFIAQK